MHANLLLEARIYSAQTYLDPMHDWVVPMARLRPGVSAKQAQAALAGSFHELARTADPKARAEDIPTLLVREGSGGLDGLRRTYSKPLYILLALVGLLQPRPRPGRAASPTSPAAQPTTILSPCEIQTKYVSNYVGKCVRWSWSARS